jgi:hypothetical protein
LAEYLDLLESNEIELFDTKVSVEYDFYVNNINPAIVIGFSSTALYTLKFIYPQAQVNNIYISLSDLELNRGHELLREYYTKCGIETLYLC